MKLIIAALGVLLLLAGCGGEKAPTYRQVSPSEAAAMMETEADYILLDVRTQEEYRQSHIPGAICVPNETIGSEEIPALPDKAQLILVYCRSGNRSKNAARILAGKGYKVLELGTGFRGWVAADKPIEK